jgi:ribosome-associated protein
MATTLHVSAQIAIPRSELKFTFVRSSGPGGQNVNKVASKAVLHWSIRQSAAITDDVRGRLFGLARRRVNDRGELVLTSQRYRDQARNIEDCLEKLRTLVLSAAKAPRKRSKTRMPAAAREARLRNKHRTAEKKRRRTTPRSEQ